METCDIIKDILQIPREMEMDCGSERACVHSWCIQPNISKRLCAFAGHN